MKKFYIACTLLAAILTGQVSSSQAQELTSAQLTSSAPPTASPDLQKPYHDDKIFVKFRSEATGSSLAFNDKTARGQKLKQDKLSKALLKADARLMRQAAGKAMGRNIDRIFQVELDGAKGAVDQLLTELNAMPEVEYAERVPIYYIHATPNDPLLTNNQYSLHITKAIQAFSSFNNPNSRPVKLAIVDDAVLISHSDLKANIWTNPGETGLDANGRDKATNGIDDDGNGYIDDVNGWDAADKDNNPSPPLTPTALGNLASPTVFSHGTHCAGIAGAVTGNGTGVAAVSNNKVQIVPVKSTFDNATNTNSINASFDGLAYAVRGAKADVVSMSFGGGSYSQAFQDLINEGAAMGMIFIASAGNNNNDLEQYPANYKNVISVANSDAADKKSSSSTFGKWVTITAPGNAIVSTVPGTGAAIAAGAYGSKSGTSMSAPMVAGLVGFMKSQNPSLTPEQVRQLLTSTADNIDLINPGYEGQLGAGRINAYEAIRAAGGTALAAAADFIINKSEIVIGEKVSFVNRSIGGNSYAWTFENADKATSTEKDPTVTFTSAGAHNVTLTVNGSISKTVKVNVTGFAQTDILGLPLAGPVGASGVNGHSTNNIPAFANFYKYSDGHQIAGVNISFRVATAGSSTGNIRVKVWEVDKGLPGAVLHTQTVRIADLVANGLVGTLSPNYIYFDKPVQIPADKSFYIGFEIDYGKGDNISIHHYSSAAAGSNAALYFNNRWQIAGQIGAAWTFAIFPVVAEKALFPSGNLAAKAEVCMGTPLTFSAAGITNADAYTWNFGNGSTSTDATTSAAYTAAGVYQSSLTARRNITITEGAVNYPVQLRNTFAQQVSVADCSKVPVAAFEVSAQTANAGTPVRFVNKAENATSYEWLIVQGGNRITSTEASPVITFTQKGKYDVTLIAKNPNGVKAETYKKQYVEILTAGQDCNTIDLPFPRLTAYGTAAGGAFSGHNGYGIKDYAKSFELSAGQALTKATLNVFAAGAAAPAQSTILVKVWDASGPNGRPGQVISSTPVKYTDLIQAVNTNGGNIEVVLDQPVLAPADGKVYVGFSINYIPQETFYLSTSVAGAGMGNRSMANYNGTWLSMVELVSLYTDLAIAISTIDNADKLPVAAFTASATTVGVGETIQLDAKQSKKALIYNWTVNGGTISYAPTNGQRAADDMSQASVSFDKPGIYTITLTVLGDCDAKVSTKSVQVEVTDNALLAQSESAIKGISNDMVYPNPTSGSFNLVLNGKAQEQFNISVWDVNGKLVQQRNLTLENATQTQQLSLEDQPKGLYLIRVTNGSKVQTHKLVKE
ncbi:S8 family serine peptidase [Pontibacter indicus]|uniref:Por secretion system C-terminal sorting domain-containing protein n=1 Tax=Pontibacter indicus TaxID=1317125 RepID=A0A1R3X2W4_9BACT|nr:S8 family serine peptidase [Pontibacter indicus]SIT83663.1 Por secretion system C-terminal sorting domain-containing protein [Pontibacter indicus]